MTIHVNHLEFGYGRNNILKGINLKIDTGECVSIIGPNGAGKSTLIKCMDGLLKPQKGSVMLDNQSLKDMKQEEIAKRIGYVPQAIDHYFPLKVFDMVYLGRRNHMHFNSAARDKAKVLDALKALNIEKLAMRNFSELSGGEQQKVIIARAMVQETEFLLLDEATSNLDIRHQLEVMEIIRNYTISRHIAAVMIVHDLNLAARYSDKMLIMKEGQLIASGSPEEVLTQDNIYAVYDVESSIHLVEGKPNIVPLKVKYA